VNFTATLIAQIITFGVLVWFVQRFLWGPLTNMMEERKKRIADGLAQAERGKHEKELAEQRAKEFLKEAKVQAAEVVAMAQKRAGDLFEEAKVDARAEGERLLVAARAEIERERNQAREQLREQVAHLALAGAEKILQREINADAHKDIVQSLAQQI
jgi:F-type H+-transporting ATPase subunit b